VKRLVDKVHDPRSAEHFLAAAIQATPRVDPQPFEMQRLLASVGSTKPSRAVLTLRFLVATAAVLLAVSAAAAVSTRVHGTRASNLAMGAAPSPAVPKLVPPMPSIAIAAPPEPPASPAATAEPFAAPRAASVVLPSTRLATPPRGGEDPTPVLEAIRALRGSGDADRASGLLSQYLRAHPRGVLAEDALALSIEAANARDDPRSAAVLGRRYLEQCPVGRYRAFALQATQSPAR